MTPNALTRSTTTLECGFPRYLASEYRVVRSRCMKSRREAAGSAEPAVSWIAPPGGCWIPAGSALETGPELGSSIGNHSISSPSSSSPQSSSARPASAGAEAAPLELRTSTASGGLGRSGVETSELRGIRGIDSAARLPAGTKGATTFVARRRGGAPGTISLSLSALSGLSAGRLFTAGEDIGLSQNWRQVRSGGRARQLRPPRGGPRAHWLPRGPLGVGAPRTWMRFSYPYSSPK